MHSLVASYAIKADDTVPDEVMMLNCSSFVIQSAADRNTLVAVKRFKD